MRELDAIDVAPTSALTSRVLRYTTSVQTTLIGTHSIWYQ